LRLARSRYLSPILTCTCSALLSLLHIAYRNGLSVARRMSPRVHTYPVEEGHSSACLERTCFDLKTTQHRDIYTMLIPARSRLAASFQRRLGVEISTPLRSSLSGILSTGASRHRRITTRLSIEGARDQRKAAFVRSDAGDRIAGHPAYNSPQRWGFFLCWV
jgi:hypothetical protein